MDLEWRCESLGYDGASDVRRLRAVAMDPLWLGAAAGELRNTVRGVSSTT